jgi:hypothetical protein
MVSPCLPWRKLLSPGQERLARVEAAPASGGSSGRSEPSNGLEPFQAYRRAVESHQRDTEDRDEGHHRTAGVRRRYLTPLYTPGILIAYGFLTEERGSR